MESHCIWLSESRWIANFSILMTSCLFDVSNCILSTPRWVCSKNQDSFSFLSIPAFSLDSWLLKLLSEFNLSTGYVHHCTSICILCIYIYICTYAACYEAGAMCPQKCRSPLQQSSEVWMWSISQGTPQILWGIQVQLLCASISQVA
jgi:hypothetical protein